MKARVCLIAILCIGIGTRPALAQDAVRASSRSYLPGTVIPEMTRIVPPAPSDGDPRDAADRAIFRATRTLEGSARWTMATSDDNVSTPGLMKAFSCAIGVEVTNQNAPTVYAFLGRVNADVYSVVGPLKDFYHRKRPFLVDDGAICAARSAELTNTFDYPSGHSTAGWTIGLVLSELVPERSSDVLARARAYGESRVVCGVHYASAIEAGRVAAAAMIAVLHGSEVFRSDMDSARMDLEKLRANSGPASEICKTEAATIATKPY